MHQKVTVKKMKFKKEETHSSVMYFIALTVSINYQLLYGKS